MPIFVLAGGVNALAGVLFFSNLFILCTNNYTRIRINWNDPPLKSSSFYPHPPFFRILKSYDPPHVSTPPSPLLISDKSLNELQILYNAPMILREKVQEIPKLNLPWPPLASDLAMDNVKKVVPCELYNMLAWTCGFSSEPALREYVPIEGKSNTKLTSIEVWYP